MRAEFAFLADDTAIATLILARERCEREWPDTCPVVALWLTPETKLSEPYAILKGTLPAPWVSIPAYSDAPGRSKADILALFDLAIARCGLGSD